MPNEYFQFKQFTIHQQHCAMKVGTDGVLLGALCQLPNVETGGEVNVLDVGTGTGLIALMVAQRFSSARVDAIDIDENAVMQASENVKDSPFSDRINVWVDDFSNIRQTGKLAQKRYSLIVSNPPFFTEDTSCPDDRRNFARHAFSLPFYTLAANASALLTDNGILSVIVPYVAASEFIMQCAMQHLYLVRRVDIQTTPRKEAKRVVLEFGMKSVPSHRQKLLLHNADGSVSDEYRNLTSIFYLESALR